MKKINKKINLPFSFYLRAYFKKGGFTLFELLVSISIIAILTALATVAFSGAQRKARDARRLQDMKSIQTAAEQYYSQNNYTYPTSQTTPWSGGGQNILEVFPVDPKNSDPYIYFYTYTAATNSYCACTLVENTANANSDATCNFAAVSKTYFCVKNQQ